MDTMSWTIFVFVCVVSMQICSGEKSCVIWTSVGPANLVQLGHRFQVYCTFKRQCTMSMEVYPVTQQQPKELNSTTMYFDVLVVTQNRTYFCKCANFQELDPCGVDVFTGYPPDRPQNISCIYKVVEKESGVVVCTWARGRNTSLADTAVLWVRSGAGNRSGGAVSYNVSSKGTETPSASFPALRSVQHISVWVQVENKLAAVSSSIANFTLGDIAMPPAPVLGRPDCSVSFTCIITLQQPVRTELVEIQYTADQEPWTTSHSDSVVRRNSSLVRSIGSLEPYRFYHFRARAKFSRGLWSPWSTNSSSWTQEEAPAKELNVWFAQSDSESLRVYWKEENVSISRGKIMEYRVGVSHRRTPDISLTADVRNYSVPHCTTNCVVTVWARNSKGLSPPARITTQRVKAEPPQDVRVTTSNSGVAISWREPGTASHRPSGYVVEWYPQGHKLEELRWLRLGGTDRRAILSGILPLECYEGAVYDLHKESPGMGTRFRAFATSESAPAAGPTLQEMLQDGNTATVTWTEVPRGQRGGCITKYTIYLEGNSRLTVNQSVRATGRTYTTSRLSPGTYTLWISASTAKGEGPKSSKVKFFIEQETSWSPVIVTVIVFAILLLLICLCQNPTAKQRFFKFFQCSLCEVVPDPANSKWAKECSQEKGKMKLQLQLSHPSESGEEEEPILVDVEELPRQSDGTFALTGTSSSSSQLPPQTGLNPDTDPASLLYPLTTYIKSYSLDSDSSDHTSTSVDTGTTVDYISSHGLDNLDEEDEEETETQFVEMRFFPSRNIFKEPLDFGGKLTLDAVKIDCSDLFHNFQGDSEN